jgi:hypothetical protein
MSAENHFGLSHRGIKAPPGGFDYVRRNGVAGATALYPRKNYYKLHLEGIRSFMIFSIEQM